MKLYQTNQGVFVKRLGKVFVFVGDAFAEVPVLTAKQIYKLQQKAQKAEESDES